MQPAGDVDEQPVAGGMAEGVVERPEAIEVEQDQTDAVALGVLGDRLLGGEE